MAWPSVPGPEHERPAASAASGLELVAVDRVVAAALEQHLQFVGAQIRGAEKIGLRQVDEWRLSVQVNDPLSPPKSSAVCTIGFMW
jgi:hypothetical protein